MQEGDTVQEFDPICEVQSDKASIEITSRYAGQILKMHHELGTMVKVGAPLVEIQTADAAEETGAAGGQSVAEQPAAAKRSTAVEFSAAELFPASIPGRDSDASASNVSPHSGTSASPSATDRKPVTAAIRASPAVRRQAKDAALDLAMVPGTGPDGRITKDDLIKFMEQQNVTPGKQAEQYSSAAAAMHAARDAPPGALKDFPPEEEFGLPESAAEARQLQQAVTEEQPMVAVQPDGTSAAAGAAAAGATGYTNPGVSIPLRGYKRCVERFYSR